MSEGRIDLREPPPREFDRFENRARPPLPVLDDPAFAHRHAFVPFRRRPAGRGLPAAQHEFEQFDRRVRECRRTRSFPVPPWLASLFTKDPSFPTPSAARLAVVLPFIARVKTRGPAVTIPPPANRLRRMRLSARAAGRRPKSATPIELSQAGDRRNSRHRRAAADGDDHRVCPARSGKPIPTSAATASRFPPRRGADRTCAPARSSSGGSQRGKARNRRLSARGALGLLRAVLGGSLGRFDLGSGRGLGHGPPVSQSEDRRAARSVARLGGLMGRSRSSSRRCWRRACCPPTLRFSASRSGACGHSPGSQRCKAGRWPRPRPSSHFSPARRRSPMPGGWRAIPGRRPTTSAPERTFASAALPCSNELHGKDYQRIIVVGHSLGSILAYDLIGYFWARRAAGSHFVEGGLTISRRSNGSRRRSPGSTGRRHPRAAAAFRQAQRALSERLRRRPGPKGDEADARWLITDFVTLGSPLTHAEFLLAQNAGKLQEQIARRQFTPARPCASCSIPIPVGGCADRRPSVGR